MEPIISKFDPSATILEPEYWCPACGSLTFSNLAAVWCSDSELESGPCTYYLMTG